MIDKNKTYKTRDRRAVRIYATEGKRGGEVHGAVDYTEEGYYWCIREWESDGSYIPGQEHDCDLIEVRPRIKRTIWLNVYEEYVIKHTRKDVADADANNERLACVKIEIDCEEGEGI